jgi:hypothetical protein
MSDQATRPDAPRNSDLDRMVEETRVSAGLAGFPKTVIVEILTADGTLARFVLGAMLAHKLSDDLLRAVAIVKRGNADTSPST